jgi:hypothetical protein
MQVLLTMACLGALGGQARAQAAAPRTGLWPLRAEQVGDDAAWQVTVALRKELDQMLAGRVATQDEVDAARARPEVAKAGACVEEVSCALAVAEALHVTQLLTGTVRNQGDLKAVEVRLVDVGRGREAGRVSAPLPANSRELGSVLRELLARLVMPEGHVGTLVLNGIDPSADVTVDNEKRVLSGSTTPTVRVPLRVGKHTVEVKRQSKNVMTEVVDIRFEEIVVLGLPPAGVVVPNSVPGHPKPGDAPAKAEAATFRIPLWVGPVVMAVAVLPLLVAAAAAFDMLFIGPMVIATPSKCEPWTVNGSGGGVSLNSKATPLNTCGSLWRVTSRKETSVMPALLLDLGGLGIAGVVMVGALGLGGTLLLGSILGPMLESQDIKHGTEQIRPSGQGE